jgi:hypothetical protein
MVFCVCMSVCLSVCLCVCLFVITNEHLGKIKDFPNKTRAWRRRVSNLLLLLSRLLHIPLDLPVIYFVHLQYVNSLFYPQYFFAQHFSPRFFYTPIIFAQNFCHSARVAIILMFSPSLRYYFLCFSCLFVCMSVCLSVCLFVCIFVITNEHRGKIKQFPNIGKTMVHEEIEPSTSCLKM